MDWLEYEKQRDIMINARTTIDLIEGEISDIYVCDIDTAPYWKNVRNAVKLLMHYVEFYSIYRAAIQGCLDDPILGSFKKALSAQYEIDRLQTLMDEAENNVFWVTKFMTAEIEVTLKTHPHKERRYLKYKDLDYIPLVVEGWKLVMRYADVQPLPRLTPNSDQVGLS